MLCAQQPPSSPAFSPPARLSLPTEQIFLGRRLSGQERGKQEGSVTLSQGCSALCPHPHPRASLLSSRVPPREGSQPGVAALPYRAGCGEGGAGRRRHTERAAREKLSAPEPQSRCPSGQLSVSRAFPVDTLALFLPSPPLGQRSSSWCCVIHVKHPCCTMAPE